MREVGADALAAELVKQLQLRGGDGLSLLVDPASNTILVDWRPESSAMADVALKRISDLDDASRRAWTGIGTNCGRPMEGDVFALQHANAVELARMLNAMLDPAATCAWVRFVHGALESAGHGSDTHGDLSREFREGYQPAFRFAADTRTNSVIVSGASKEDVARVRDLIARLDQDQAPRR